MRRPRWVNPYVGIVVGGIAAMAVMGNVTRQHYDTPARDTRSSGDVCHWMREGDDVLTPGDWQRLGKFSTRGSLVLYVQTHCPSQLAKVTS